MAKVYVIAPDGSKGTVSEEELADAQKAGFTVDTVRNTASQATGDAALSGASRGLTLGLVDVGPVFGGPRLQAAQRAVKEENPVAFGAGELAGQLVNPVSRIGGAGKTVAAKVASGALEGSLFGLGSALTEDALGDQQALSEQLAARVGGAALMGGIVNGAVAKVLGGAERVALSEEAVKLPNALDDFAQKAASTIRKDAITNDRALAKAGVDWDELNAWAKSEGLFTHGSTADSIFQASDAAMTRAKAQSLDALTRLNEKGLPNAAALYDVLTPLARDGDELALLEAPGLVRKARQAQEYLGKEASRELVAVDSAYKFIGGADEATFDWQKLRNLTDTWSRKPTTAPLAEALRVEALKQARKLDPEAAAALESSFKAERFGSFLKKQLGGVDESLNASDLVGAAVTAGAFSGPAALVTAPLAAVGSHLARTRGPHIVANLLESLPETSAVRAAAESLLTQVKARLNTLPELLGPFRIQLENAAAEGASSLLATHMQLASGAAGDEYLSTLGLQRENPADLPAYGAKAQSLATLMKAKAQFESELHGAVKQLDSDGRDVRASERDFWSAYESVQKLASTPPVDQSLMSTLPNTGMGLTGKLAEAAQHVYNAAPRDPNEHLPESLRPRWEPTAVEQARFLARTQAAFEPLAALGAIMRGEPAQERLATLSALYPRLLEQAQERLFERLNSAKKLTWEQRQRIAPLLGPEALGLSAQQLAIIAAAHAKSATGGQEPPPRPNGRQMVNQSQNYNTQSQRIEARRNQK